MKKPLIAAGLLLLGLAGYGIAGRNNRVVHIDRRTGLPEEISASGGSCRHHLTAHPGDMVATGRGLSSNPDDCN